MKEKIDILDVFYKLSSDAVRSFLVSLSVFPEETGETVFDIIEGYKEAFKIENLETLQSHFDELQQFGLVGCTKLGNGEKLEMNDRVWLKKGVRRLVTQYITEEED